MTILRSRRLVSFAVAAGALAVLTVVWLRAGPSPWTASAAPQKHVVDVGEDWFCDPQYQGGVCETTVTAGDTVSWDFSGAKSVHTSTECNVSCDTFPPPAQTPLWDSGVVQGGTAAPFEMVFSEPGIYSYYCQVHYSLQQGRIIVLGAGVTPTVTNTPPPTATRTSTPTRTPTPVATVDAGGNGDVNCNDRTDAIDAALELQKTAGLFGSFSCPQNADVNRDGRADAIDASLILQYAAGLIPSLPVG